MKIAYQFFGHLRTFRSNATPVINLIYRYPGDVFVHTYSHLNTSAQTWHGDSGGNNSPVTQDDIKFILDHVPGVRAIEVDQQSCGAPYLEEPYKKCAARWTVQQVNKLRRRYEEDNGVAYDVVFLLRFDLVFIEPFVMPEIIEPNTLYGGQNHNAINQGLDGDVFVFARPHVMNLFTMPAMPEFAKPVAAACGFQGEQLSTVIRKHHGFAYKAHDTSYGLLRSGGLMKIN